ncbi:MAG: type II secretion system F family protein [Bdellovibrionales bacterium]|nr:type II secretion system F family protein [Bdellovibrionales bacterium]
MKFRYTGYDSTARKVSGDIDAGTEFEVRSRLRSQNIRPISIASSEAPKTVNETATSLLALLSSPVPDLMEFTAFIRQLATMQSAGISIVQALKVLSDQVDNRGFGEILAKVQKQIEEGSSLTESLRKYPKIFDRIFINLIAAGEVSGSLDKVLQRLAIYYEKSASLRRKVKGAMTYPIIIVFIVIAVLTVLLTFVVPTFAQMFQNGGKPLPAPTLFLMNISSFVRTKWYVLLGGAAGTGFGVYWCFTNEGARRVIDPYLMKLPIFGDLIQKIGIARFSRTFGTMIQSGVPILDALEITSRIAGNYAIESAIQATRLSITQGNSIAAPLLATNVFPKMAVSMISIGEQTGALDQMLTKIAEFYEDEVDTKVMAMTSILEPLMIVIVGIVVASVLVPMYLPIFQMADVMSGPGG